MTQFMIRSACAVVCLTTVSAFAIDAAEKDCFCGPHPWYQYVPHAPYHYTPPPGGYYRVTEAVPYTLGHKQYYPWPAAPYGAQPHNWFYPSPQAPYYTPPPGQCYVPARPCCPESK